MRSNKNILKALLVSLLFSSAGIMAVDGQVTVDATIDSLEMFVGQQSHIKLEVSMNAKSKLQLPIFKSGYMVPGVEVLEASKPDTEAINEGARLVISQIYTITSFDSAVYYLPPLRVMVDGKPYESKSLALKVLTLNVDTVHYDQFFGPKTVMAPPFSWHDWSAIFWMSVLLLLLSGASLYLYMRYRDNKPIIRHIKILPKLPPHKKAMQEIERIKEEKTWAQEDSKEYYTKLTDTLRTYIEERYGFSAMEMTSGEIIEKLMSLHDDEALNELRVLFQTADLVKFAKYSTLINENDMNLVNAIEFINQTKMEEDLNAKPQVKELTVGEKRSISEKRRLALYIAVCSLVSVGVLVWIVWRIYNLCI
jgi:hypothetical protein